MKLFTIGFTKKSAEEFFSILKKRKVKRVIDIRLNNRSQLAGFAKQDDLKYFLRAICDIDYIHITDFAPTQEILDVYKKKKGEWSVFERDFIELIKKRKIENSFKSKVFDHACLLCSEQSPEHCHRRLVGEYLQEKNGNIDLCHL